MVVSRIRTAWDRTVVSLAAAGREGDAQAAAAAVIAAGPLRARLAELDPLSVLADHGARVAGELAAIQDPGRRFFWQLVLAGELAEKGEIDSARSIVAQIVDAPRLSDHADDLVAPLIAPLLAVEPELAERLVGFGLRIWPALELFAAAAPEEKVRLVAANLERRADWPYWESSMIRGVISARRWDLGRELCDLIEGPCPELGARERTIDAETRRLRALRSLDQGRPGSDDEPELPALPGDERPARRALEAARSGERESALGLLAEHDEAAGEGEVPERLCGESEAVRILAVLGEPELARRRLDAARRLAAEPEAPDDTAKAWAEVHLAKAEIAVGEYESGALRLLQAVNQLEDHDTSYDAVDDAVEIAAEQGRLGDLLAQLPRHSRELFYRTRLVTSAAFVQAREGRVAEAFETARSLPKSESADAHGLLAEILLYRGLLPEAERAALHTAHPAPQLCRIAVTHARNGAASEARRIFELAMGQMRHMMEIGEVLLATVRDDPGGDPGPARLWVAGHLDLLLGEAVGETTPHRSAQLASGAKHEARQWLSSGHPPRRFGVVGDPAIPEESIEEESRTEEQANDPRPPTVGERLYTESRRAREHAARGDLEAARAPLAAALEAWRELPRDGYEKDVTSLPLLALAVSEAEPGRAAELLSEIEPVVRRVIDPPRYSCRSDRRRDLAWALTDLGDWKGALEIAHGIVSPGERRSALTWLVVRAPLEWLTSRPAFLEDEAVRPMMLARFGLEDEQARTRVEAELTEAGDPS